MRRCWIAALSAAAKLLVDHFRPDPHGVPRENDTGELPFADAEKRNGPRRRAVRPQSRSDRHDQHAVGDRPAKRRRLREVMVGVNRVEIARHSREIHDVGFRHCAGL